MKNLIIGLVIGALVTFFSMKLFSPNATKTGSVVKNAEANSIEAVADQAKARAQASAGLEQGTATATTVLIDKSQNSTVSLAQEPQTIDEYRALVADMRAAMNQQNDVIEQLTQVKNKLEKDADVQGGGRRQQAELSQAQIENAKQAMSNAIVNAEPEFAEVLSSALDYYNKTKTVSPGSEALLRHYADEPDYTWSEVAQGFLQNFFASYTAENIQVIQMNCRATYCELYGNYTSKEPIADHRVGGAAISELFNAMELVPGFSDLFRGLESSSINVSSDNNFMTFHNFIRNAKGG